MIQGL